MKGKRLYDENEPESSSITCSGNSAKRYSESEKISNSSGCGSRVDMDNPTYSYARNEERRNIYHLREENGENILANRHVDEMEEIGRTQGKNERPREKKNDNLNYQSSQDAIGR